MRRVVIPELLDTDSGSEDEIRASLADLRRINRWFGGISTTRTLLRHVANRTGLRRMSLLEVAAGSGDVPVSAANDLARHGICVDVTLLDRSPSHLNGYRRSLTADARALPFRDGAFDVVSCGLFVHHLEPAELKAFVQESLRVARVCLLINDLRRSPLHLAFIYAGMPLFRSAITRHDAVASVKRAYTPEDFRTMFAEWNLHGADIISTYLFRMGIAVWKEPEPSRTSGAEPRS